MLIIGTKTSKVTKTSTDFNNYQIVMHLTAFCDFYDLLNQQNRSMCSHPPQPPTLSTNLKIPWLQLRPYIRRIILRMDLLQFCLVCRVISRKDVLRLRGVVLVYVYEI